MAARTVFAHRAPGKLCQGRSFSLGRPCLRTGVVLSTLHALLIPAYHLLARHLDYAEPGADYFDRRHTERATRRAVRPLQRAA